MSRSSDNGRELAQVNLGRTRYKDVWDIQKRLVRLRAESRISDSLILTEHEPVLTMGRGTDRQNLLVDTKDLIERRVDLFEVERGGDITFHGPGQSVLYPIIDLRNRKRDAHQYLRDLETVVVNALGEIGLEAGIKPGLTGIWVDDHKLGAIGVAVSRWITYHGIALNVTTDLDYFKLINPCGITDYPVGSVSAMAVNSIDMEQMNKLLIKHFVKYFEYDLRPIDDISVLLRLESSAE